MIDQPLVSYSLVCRAWSHVVDLFYRVYPTAGDRPTAVSVARSLSYHPERAKFILGFNPHHYSDILPNKRLEDPDIMDTEGPIVCSANPGIFRSEEHHKVDASLLSILEMVTEVQQAIAGESGSFQSKNDAADALIHFYLRLAKTCIRATHTTFRLHTLHSSLRLSGHTTINHHHLTSPHHHLTTHITSAK